MTDAGDLRWRVVVEAPLGTPDDQGGEVRTYVSVATVWAAIVPLKSTTDVEADADGVTLRFRIIVRAPLDLTLRHRLRQGERSYRIASFHESADRRLILIDAEQRID
ncbi:MAG: phage head closure protein [Pseudomonadota bacterium]